MKKIIFLVIFSSIILIGCNNKNTSRVYVQQAKFAVKVQDSNGNWLSSLITEKNIKNIKIITSKSGVDIFLDDIGKKEFEKLTSENTNKQVGLFINDVIISAPRITETISSGELLISDDFTQSDLLNLKARLLGYYDSNSAEYKNYNLN